MESCKLVHMTFKEAEAIGNLKLVQANLISSDHTANRWNALKALFPEVAEAIQKITQNSYLK